MRIAYALLVPLAIPASIAGAQNEMVAAAPKPRIEFKTGRIPVKLPDKGFGFVQFDIEGEVGGRATGRFTLTTGGGETAATITEYLIMVGMLQDNQSEYEFVMRGSARASGSRSSEQFASQLKLAKAPRANWVPDGIEAQDSWRETAMADGDIWVIGGVPCQFIGRDLVC